MGYIIPSQSDRPHGHQQSTQAHGPRRPPRQREAGVPTPWDPRTINLSHGNLPPVRSAQ
ncbi:hypothetical protein MYCTH_2310887 [Thermothelomyces thermophilus ATCC 42464]|uniref:Uncharacterized protein n=1 Tax=Thermothelomyces thermophilus (strain ATCC 42464 / BCRC 31852 / DSM 1799) TaxID=573729 RepID=G2QM86_THET4|nr:uncharacterized protein MYCTH_2310887 [Thermothelomyces thermophilus ATCC 42464]AEO61066.1 hypothetical protein MYCTH_2310887 [Thermothelomyces thermophilus ATCC 42464]